MGKTEMLCLYDGEVKVENGLGLLRLDSLLGGSSIIVNMLLNAQARHFLGKSLTVLGMAHGIDDWVEARGSLGTERGHLGKERGDGSLATNASKKDNKGIGRPDSSPQ